MILHTSYSVVDMFWVSSLGQDAVAAVTLGGIVSWVGFSITQTFSSGALAVFARAWGAGQQEKAGRSLRDCVCAGFVTGLLYATVISFNLERVLRLLGGKPEVVDAGIPYVSVVICVFAVSMPLFTLSSAFRAAGDMVTPLWLTTLSTVLNIVLDPLLIFGIGPFPEMGLRGAAVATVASVGASFVAGVVLLARSRSGVRIQWIGRPDWRALRDVFAVGIPSGLHYILLSLTQMTMIRLVAIFGTAALATAGVASRVTMLSFLPCMGLGSATATMVGQYLGAERPEDAERTVQAAMKACIVVTAVIGVVYAAMPGPILGIFGNDPEVIRLGTVYLRIFSASFVFVSATIVLTRAFQGAGDTVWPTVVAALRCMCFIALALLVVAYTDLDTYGVWYAMGVTHVLQCIVLVFAYRKGTWKRKRLGSVDSWAT